MSKMNLRVLFGVLGLAVAMGLINNLRVGSEKSVTWFGGQPVLPAPAEAAP